MVESLQKAWELVGDKLKNHGKCSSYVPHVLHPFSSTHTHSHVHMHTYISPSILMNTLTPSHTTFTHLPFYSHKWIQYSTSSLPYHIDTARLKVDEKYLLASFTLDTPLEYLIPTTVGAGACTTALTDFLVLTHNDFIETCRAIVIKQTQWREHKIPITHIHGCHLLTYEQHLPSIILCHCRYSLIVGKGQDISYDLPALEKHLLDRFIYGKPFILLDIPQVAYRKDVYTAASFAAVRKKVEPQVSCQKE